MRCIEMTFQKSPQMREVEINYNMRCIEIWRWNAKGKNDRKINYNMRCIEMNQDYRTGYFSADKLQHEMY